MAHPDVAIGRCGQGRQRNLVRGGTLSRIAVYLQGRWHTFVDYGALVRKDGALARKDSVLSGLRCTCQIQHIFEAAIPAAHIIGSPAGHITPCFQSRLWCVCCIHFDA